MPRYRSEAQSRGGTFLNSLRAFMRTFTKRFCSLKPIVFSSLAEATSLSNLALSQKEFLRKKAEH